METTDCQFPPHAVSPPDYQQNPARRGMESRLPRNSPEVTEGSGKRTLGMALGGCVAGRTAACVGLVFLDPSVQIIG